MKLSIKNTFRNLALAVLSAAVLSACGGAGSCTTCSSSTANTGSLDKLSMVAPSSYPAGVAATVPVVVTNNGTETINNLNYTIDSASNTTGGTITIQTASAASCRIIAPQASCTLNADIAAIPATRPGDFSVAVSQGSLTNNGTQRSSSATTVSVTTNIGLVELPSNIASGADGVTIYYPNAIVGNSNNGANQIIVTAVVTSANAGSFNTISLVDSNGNPLSYTVLSGNSGDGMSPLAIGSIVTMLVTIPNGSNQLQFTTQTKQNTQVVSTATNSNMVAVSDPALPTGILTVSPNYFNLTPSYESQTITLSNSGNGAITSLNFTPLAPLTQLSTTCGASLAAKASCQYIVKFNKDIPEAGTTSLTINYNNGISAQSATATVNYTGVDPVAGLTISSGSGSANFDFSSRTNTPQDTEIVTLTNSGNTVESGFSYTLPAHFSVNTAVANACTPTTQLSPGASCNVNLVYNNNQVTNGAISATIPVDYKYGSDAKDAHGNISVTYQTLQSQAILVLSPNPVNFANIVNNNAESNSQTISLTNTGDLKTIAISPVFMPSQSYFSYADNNCGNSLESGTSCSYTISFGPTTASSGIKNANFQINYYAYSNSAGAPVIVSTDTALSGFVAAAQGANLSYAKLSSAGFAGGDGGNGTSYMVQQSATSPTISYTITNSGAVPATSFYLSSTLSSTWSITSNSCGNSLGSSVTLAANGGSCVVTFSLNTSSIGSPDLNLNAITMNWVDQDTPGGQSQALSGIVYTTVYAPASIAVTTIPASSISIAPGESFSMTATLSGGYNVAAQMINAATTTAGISFENNGCALNSQNSYTCTISAMADSSATPASGQITLSNSTTSSMAPNPSTVNFAIAPTIVQIVLPQTGQLYCVPGTSYTTTCGADYQSVAGTDGYGLNPDTGIYIPYGVTWAYNGGNSTTPPTRFTAGPNTNCEITDNLTGLIWLKDPSIASGTAVAWNTALSTTNAGTWCGQVAGTWRLPNVNELSSLLNLGAGSSPNIASWLITQGFTNVQAREHWSSTTYAPYTSYAWIVNMSDGNVFTGDKVDDYYYVWPVRGGQ